MKLSAFYNAVIKLGSRQDPRGGKETYSYADSAILNGDGKTEVRKILVGVDIEVAELLLADAIRKREGLDLVVSHHPEGKAYAALYKVMQVQVDLLRQAGVSGKTAQELLNERMSEVERRVLPANHTRPVDAARLLDLPFLCMHTPADNHVYSYLKKLFDKEKPKTVGDILDLLNAIPEYNKAGHEVGTGPRVIMGSIRRSAGKILLEMTGGTEGHRDVFDKLYKAGVRTLVSMHLSEEHFKKVKDANLNVVIAGHISSDTLGLNLLLDGLEKEAGHKFQTLACSGFCRIRRK